MLRIAATPIAVTIALVITLTLSKRLVLIGIHFLVFYMMSTLAVILQ